MKRRRSLFLAGFLIASGLGCQAILGIDGTTFSPDSGASDANAGDGSTSDATGEAGSGSLSVSPSTVRIAPGGSADVTVTITRAGDTSDVQVSANDLDAGVTIAPITIASGASTGTLHVAVPASASAGAQDIAMIHASLSGAANVPLTVVVPGLPGTIDETFANGQASFGPSTAIAVAVAVQSTGEIVVGGQPGGGTGWSIVRFDISGVLDATFDTNAAETIPSGGQLSDLALGTHDDIYATGSNGSQLVVYHLNADGTRDNTFGTLGVAQLGAVDYPQGSNGLSIDVQSDDRPVVVGTQNPTGSPVPILVRFATNGAWDETFGSNGHVQLTTDQTLGGVVVLPDDRIAAGGTDTATLPLDLIAAHFTKDGAADTAFSATGFVRSGTNNEWTAGNIAIGPDAGYLTVGKNAGVTTLGCIIGLFTATGDAGTFAPLTSTGAAYDSCTSAITQSDGHFLVTGFGGHNQQNWAYVERMLSPSAVDPSFNGGSGVLFFADHGLNPSVAFRSFYDVAIAPDSRIVAVGGVDSAGAMVVRIWP
ncbi:MAG: hypothetical protein ACRELY_10905 [Polyangiaceae bacterium]